MYDPASHKVTGSTGMPVFEVVTNKEFEECDVNDQSHSYEDIEDMYEADSFVQVTNEVSSVMIGGQQVGGRWSSTPSPLPHPPTHSSEAHGSPIDKRCQVLLESNVVTIIVIFVTLVKLIIVGLFSIYSVVCDEWQKQRVKMQQNLVKQQKMATTTSGCDLTWVTPPSPSPSLDEEGQVGDTEACEPVMGSYSGDEIAVILQDAPETGTNTGTYDIANSMLGTVAAAALATRSRSSITVSSSRTDVRW